MKVIAGKYRGLKLNYPDPSVTRPTTSMVKEALFSILNFQINGKVVLDLFSGSGALGIEALSRGARRVYFNDHHQAAIKVIQENLLKLKDSPNYMVYHGDYLQTLQQLKEKIDIIIIDPPYQQFPYQQLLSKIIDLNLLNEESLIVIECEKEHLQLNFDGFIKRTYVYGTKGLIILKRT